MVTLEKIELALSQSNSDKAPGPDGLNSGTLKLLWTSIKADILKAFSIFTESGQLPRGMNSSLFSLIPKVASPSMNKDFRLISLINFSLKLLSKVLKNRLAKVMDKLVSPNQSSFIKGRQISEGILITGEIVHSIKNKEVEGMIFKLDFEKAFDSAD